MMLAWTLGPLRGLQQDTKWLSATCGGWRPYAHNALPGTEYGTTAARLSSGEREIESLSRCLGHRTFEEHGQPSKTAIFSLTTTPFYSEFLPQSLLIVVLLDVDTERFTLTSDIPYSLSLNDQLELMTLG